MHHFPTMKFPYLAILTATILASLSSSLAHFDEDDAHPLSKIAIHKATWALPGLATIQATPTLKATDVGGWAKWVQVEFKNSQPAIDDWVGVFSPANFNSSNCEEMRDTLEPPYICTAPIKYKYANDSNPDYIATGEATLTFMLINQRADFSFALFSGGFLEPKVLTVSNTIAFTNPKAPLYPRLALGKSWDIMTVTWTSGYNINEAEAFVEWGTKGQQQIRSPALTTTYRREDICGSPARTVGWRDPGYFHTSFMKDLWPNTDYTYKLGHKLSNGSYDWSTVYSFKSSPHPGQDSMQRIVIFGDMGASEVDGATDYNNESPGSYNTTERLRKEIELGNYDIIFNIGDLAYADGYLSTWDLFTARIQDFASRVPFMVASGNHERTWPNSGSFYNHTDSGGECGVPAETMFYFPAENTAKFWYKADFGMFRFCIANTELDWRPGTEQYKFLEECFATVDRKKQPWLIFAAHRPIGYSSNDWFAKHGTYGEPMGRGSLQKLWQKYKVDMAFYGHVHNYERTYPTYQDQVVSEEKSHYSGTFNATIHIVAGGGGHHLSTFSNCTPPMWTVYRDFDWGYVHLTAYNRSTLLLEYKKSRDGKVYDTFTITRQYQDVLACVHDSCFETTLAS